MSLFFTKRAKIDRWHVQEMKKLNDNYFSHRDTGAVVGGESAIQRANTQHRELEKAKNALNQEYVKRLTAIGQKPRVDFTRVTEES